MPAQSCIWFKKIKLCLHRLYSQRGFNANSKYPNATGLKSKKKFMKRIRLRLFLFLSATILTTVSFAQKPRPNVLFIAVDDLNDYIALLQNFPGVKTPNLDALANTSLTFTRAYCAAPVCNPSRAAILSGLAPYRTGVYENTDKIINSNVIMQAAFLPEHFKDNGYITITRGKIFHTIPGKERYKAMWDIDGGRGDYGPYPTVHNVWPAVRAPKNFTYQPWSDADEEHPDIITANFIIAQLDKKFDKPFFMTCGFYKPHVPWTAPQRFFDMFPLETVQLPKVLESDWDDLPPIAKKWADSPVDYEELKQSGKWKEVVRGYLACISFMDWNLGRVIKKLESSPYKDNTIICLFADNGFHLGEKKHFTKFALWEQTTHILSMWRVPGITKPGVCGRTVTLLDIYPTLIELCNLPNPVQKLDGRSIVSLLKNPLEAWPHPAITTYQEGNQSIRIDQYRYIHYADGKAELYDEKSDPLEWKNIANEPGMKKLIDDLKSKLETNFAPANKNDKVESDEE